MRSFDIPTPYKSSIIAKVKANRKAHDSRKQDFSPTLLDFGPVRFYLARHFGFCYGVENAIETIYKTINENTDKRIFLLSEMIHNPKVNQDLLDLGVQFMMKTSGEMVIPWSEITQDDIVVIPAFGTTIETERKLEKIGVETKLYNTTCPFVEKVWNRSTKLGEEDYTVIVHGKKNHEETRATFSHSKENTHSIVIQNIEEAEELSRFIKGAKSKDLFYQIFEGRFSNGFDPEIHLQKVGVVNQTTMLATETQAIADFLKQIMIELYGDNDIKKHFADTRDTLCYATSDNQNAVYGLLKQKADLAIVVGGYNSSNTSHLAELCEKELTTFFISSSEKITSPDNIIHFDLHKKKEVASDFLPNKQPLDILITSGASCPDATVDSILQKIISFYPNSRTMGDITFM